MVEARQQDEWLLFLMVRFDKWVTRFDGFDPLPELRTVTLSEQRDHVLTVRDVSESVARFLQSLEP